MNTKARNRSSEPVGTTVTFVGRGYWGRKAASCQQWVFTEMNLSGRSHSHCGFATPPASLQDAYLVSHAFSLHNIIEGDILNFLWFLPIRFSRVFNMMRHDLPSSHLSPTSSLGQFIKEVMKGVTGILFCVQYNTEKDEMRAKEEYIEFLSQNTYFKQKYKQKIVIQYQKYFSKG